MAYLDDLKTTRDQIAANLVTITANPKPSYMIDGQSVQWTAYFNALTNQMKAIEEAIARAEGPDEQLTEVYTDVHPLR